MKKFSNKLFRLLKSDIKDLNSVVLSLVGTFVLVGATILAYNLNSSFALFSYETSSDKILKMSPGFSLDESGANAPVLSGNMIPVYYDSEDNTWRKADSANLAEDYQWYDYDSKMWANSVTVSDSYKNTKARDLTMYEKNGELKGSVISSDGLSFDGVDDYVLMPSNLGVSFPASYSVKFKTSSTENQIIFGDHTTGAALGLYNSNNGLIVSLNTSTTVFNTGGLEQNKLYTVDIVYNSLTNVKAYLNGKELSSSGAQNHWSWEDSNNYLGRRSSDTNFKGVIEKFIVYDDILTIDEINYNLSVDNSFVGGKGVIADNLKLYYNFKMNPREYYLNSSLGTAVSMDDILTMQVWIPRYKYTVWNYNSDGYTGGDPQTIQIEFENGTLSSGEINCSDSFQGTSNGASNGEQSVVSEVCKLKSTNATCTDDTCNGKTYTHPAFTFGKEELSGFWIGKFELATDVDCAMHTNQYLFNKEGSCNVDTIRPLVKPNLSSWRAAMVSVYQNNMMAMNDSGNQYGFVSTDETRMIKNMEWGAVAYLSHSDYGVNGRVYANTASTFTTGCGPQAFESFSSGSVCNSYDTELGETASTTGNIYGVYDMVGGSYDYVMANVTSFDGKEMMTGSSYGDNYDNYSGYTGYLSSNNSLYTGVYDKIDNKYYDRYSYNNVSDRFTLLKLGDGIKEPFDDGPRLTWYRGGTSIPPYYYPWFNRGGVYYNGNSASIFHMYYYTGGGDGNTSSRLVIS